jgi:hypothetical protein
MRDRTLRKVFVYLEGTSLVDFGLEFELFAVFHALLSQEHRFVPLKPPSHNIFMILTIILHKKMSVTLYFLDPVTRLIFSLFSKLL